MIAATVEHVYTSKDAAARLSVTDARVRQLCIEHAEIGRKHGNAWLLTEADIVRIENLPEFGKRGRDQS